MTLHQQPHPASSTGTEQERPRLSDVAHAINDIPVGCEAIHHGQPCEAPAMWLVTSNHTCHRHHPYGTLCHRHLTDILTTPEPMRCHATGETWIPANTWVVRFEPL